VVIRASKVRNITGNVLLLYANSHNCLRARLALLVLMNFEEAMDLLKELSSVQVRGLEVAPKYRVYDNQNAGYVLWTKAAADDADYARFIKEIAEKRKLRVTEFRDYLIISSQK
jgi:hypothetical protein